MIYPSITIWGCFGDAELCFLVRPGGRLFEDPQPKKDAIEEPPPPRVHAGSVVHAPVHLYAT